MSSLTLPLTLLRNVHFSRLAAVACFIKPKPDYAGDCLGYLRLSTMSNGDVTAEAGNGYSVAFAALPDLAAEPDTEIFLNAAAAKQVLTAKTTATITRDGRTVTIVCDGTSIMVYDIPQVAWPDYTNGVLPRFAKLIDAGEVVHDIYLSSCSLGVLTRAVEAYLKLEYSRRRPDMLPVHIEFSGQETAYRWSLCDGAVMGYTMPCRLPEA